MRQHTPAMLRSADIVITDRALVGSLGPDAVTAGAAFRAGISRASELDYYDAEGPSRVGACLRAHTAGGLTHGFVGAARLVRLLSAALRDLALQPGLQAFDPRKLGCFVAAPSPGRTLEGALAIDDPDKQQQQLEAASATVVPSLHEYTGGVLELALADSPWQRFAQSFVPVSAGHASVAQACMLAAESLRQGSIEAAVVIAVDSLVDVDTLDWLSLLKRLRTEDRPAGVVPGEACGILVLQTAALARAQQRRALCTLTAIGLDADPRNLLQGQASTGAVLAKLIDDVAQRSANSWFFIDHNGETARAAEWGNTLFHLTRRHADYAGAQLVYPAIGFGDTGAASGAVAACLAISAWERGYAPAKAALICSAADGPERAVMCLEQAVSARPGH